MPQLDPSSFSSQLFWLVVTFGLLYLVIAKLALPEIGKVLCQRQDRIQSDLENAEKLKEEAKILKEEYNASLQSTKEEANMVIAKAAEDANEEALSRHSELDEMLAKKMSEAEKIIEKAGKEAVEKFTPVAASLTQDIVAKLTNLEIGQKAASEQVSKVMKGV